MRVSETGIAGVQRVELEPRSDHRGSFARLFCREALRGLLQGRSIAQVNHSVTATPGALRGMHYQRPPQAEMKLIRCLRGRVFDVAVDLRRGSPTFLKWVAQELSAEEPALWVIPEGCAHGFQVLEPDSELLYLHTAFYEPALEGGVRYDDPALGIDWPLPAIDLSERDTGFVAIGPEFDGIDLQGD